MERRWEPDFESSNNVAMQRAAIDAFARWVGGTAFHCGPRCEFDAFIERSKFGPLAVEFKAYTGPTIILPMRKVASLAKISTAPHMRVVVVVRMPSGEIGAASIERLLKHMPPPVFGGRNNPRVGATDDREVVYKPDRGLFIWPGLKEAA